MNDRAISRVIHYTVGKLRRYNLQLKAGQRFSLVTKGNSISLIPQKISIESFRGVLKGADISNIRNRDEKI
ncbi:MAG: AbrB family transcriptional regulator [Cyanobacterium sp. T60_A2020_053]|nr:AbrB family transcriptional regulator [Cyanobacterium sp. T60_A2020_053]